MRAVALEFNGMGRSNMHATRGDLLLLFSLRSPEQQRGTEEALAVGGALVLDFDVGARFTCS